MISLTAVFWMLVLLFAVIGGFRGWAKEVLVLFSLILALFLMRVLEAYVPGVQGALASQGPQEQVILRSSLMIMLAFFGYHTPTLAGFTGKFTREKLQDWLLGSVLGMVNGYFLFGTIWYYLNLQGYPWPNLFFAAPDPAAVQGLMQYMPPVVLDIPYIFFAIGAAFVIVIIVFL